VAAASAGRAVCKSADGCSSVVSVLMTQGCFTALFQVNADLWHDVSITAVLYILQGLCLGAGFLQVRSATTCSLAHTVHTGWRRDVVVAIAYHAIPYSPFNNVADICNLQQHYQSGKTKVYD